MGQPPHPIGQLLCVPKPQVADGSFDLERSFDDFRMVVGDNTL